MRLIRHKTHIDFLGQKRRKIALAVSALVVVVSLVSLATRGLEFGIDFTGGISNCARDLPGRKIGICRAYVAKAMEYGLDSGIVNPAHHFGESDANPELLGLVSAYANMDGSTEKMTDAMMLMGQFCASAKK